MRSNWPRAIVRSVLPGSTRRWIREKRERRHQTPPIGRVRFGSLRRSHPISAVFGIDRGLSIDRYYIEGFLRANKSDIRGHVLEIGEDTYTREFGDGRVTKRDVLHVEHGNPKSTIVADLTAADHVPSASFDCIILTQTLQFIFDAKRALRTLHRILRPDGVLLATFPGISQISRYDMDRWGDYWRFTDASTRRLFDEVFGAENVTVATHGNVFVACAFLYGLAAHELSEQELDYGDPDYQVLITVRSVRKAPRA